MAAGILDEDFILDECLVFNSDLIWENDWSGDDVGHPEVLTVGCYYYPENKIYFYVDMETIKVLDSWVAEE